MGVKGIVAWQVGRGCPQRAGGCPKPPDGALGTDAPYLGQHLRIE